MIIKINFILIANNNKFWKRFVYYLVYHSIFKINDCPKNKIKLIILDLKTRFKSNVIKFKSN